MGTLKLRNLGLIHEGSRNALPNQGYTTITHVYYTKENFKGNIDARSYTTYGCCTSTTDRHVTISAKYEYMYIGLEIDKFPSKFRNMELVNKWVEFMNNTLPFFDIKVVSDFKQKLINPEFWEKKGITFSFDKSKIYFVIKKDYSNVSNGRIYTPLFQLSLLRYFVSSEYWFMIYDCLKLRERKSLAKLSNLDIINIARFGVQTSEQIFTRTHNGSYEYGFLRSYRSPFYLSWLAYHMETPEQIITNLNNKNPQNVSCHGNTVINLNILYLMHLFQRGHYLKLFKIITDPKYHVSNHNFSVSDFFKKHFGTTSQIIRFYDLKNINFNIKKYESTL